MYASLLWRRESDHANAMFIKIFERYSLNLGIYPKKCNDTSNKYLTDAKDHIEKNQWYAVLQNCHYSLCFAELGTENVAKTYALRAEGFLNIDRFKECSADIALAFGVENLSSELLNEIKELHLQCIYAYRYSDDYVSEVQRFLSYEPNTMFPALANVLDVQMNEQFGRHIVAKCDIPVGKTILIESPFVSFKYADGTKACDTCQEIKSNLIACNFCTNTMFCNEECKNQNLYHDYECGFDLGRIGPLKLIVRSVLAALKLFATIDELIEFVEICVKSPRQLPHVAIGRKMEYYLFLTLYPDYDGLIPQSVINLAEPAFQTVLDLPSVRQYSKTEYHERFLMHLTLKSTVICLKAMFTFSDTDSDLRFTAIKIATSLFNHSCAPNVANVDENGREIGFTIKPIKKGEQLFISYFKRKMSTEERRSSLQTNFGFECRCEKCEPRFQTSDVAMINSDKLFTCLTRKHQSGGQMYRYTCGSEVKLKCEEFLTKYGHLPWCAEIEHIQNIYKYTF